MGGGKGWGEVEGGEEMQMEGEREREGNGDGDDGSWVVISKHILLRTTRMARKSRTT